MAGHLARLGWVRCKGRCRVGGVVEAMHWDRVLHI